MMENYFDKCCGPQLQKDNFAPYSSARYALCVYYGVGGFANVYHGHAVQSQATCTCITVRCIVWNVLLSVTQSS